MKRIGFKGPRSALVQAAMCGVMAAVTQTPHIPAVSAELAPAPQGLNREQRRSMKKLKGKRK